MLAQPTHRLGARGPLAFDCWSMAQLVQFHLFGRVLRNVDLGATPSRTDVLRAVRSHGARMDWEESGAWTATAELPTHGAMVTMAHRDTPWHVGVFLAVDRGVCLHLSESGLCADDRVVLEAKGYSTLLAHRYIGG
jgi:hypothetical protein